MSCRPTEGISAGRRPGCSVLRAYSIVCAPALALHVVARSTLARHGLLVPSQFAETPAQVPRPRLGSHRAPRFSVLKGHSCRGDAGMRSPRVCQGGCHRPHSQLSTASSPWPGGCHRGAGFRAREEDSGSSGRGERMRLPRTRSRGAGMPPHVGAHAGHAQSGEARSSAHAPEAAHRCAGTSEHTEPASPSPAVSSQQPGNSNLISLLMNNFN